jgi:mono/diheme cytochrome c family protein
MRTSTTTHRFLSFALALVLAAVAWAGCAQENAPASTVGASGDDGGSPDGGVVGPQFCTQTRAESLPARLAAVSAQASSSSQVVLVSQLFDDFTTTCGLCHGTLSAMGSFQIAKVSDFTLDYIRKQNVLSHVESNLACPVQLDPTNVNEPMPPCGEPNAMPYSMRGPNDEVRIFAELLEQWIAAGGPASFTPGAATPDAGAEAGADGGGAASAFAMTLSTADSMTNIGNCIPSRALVDVAQVRSRSLALDATFAAAKSVSGGSPAQYLGLPEKLSETDLFTLDSSTLAQYGVVAYAPGYPLWSDDAGKLRYVRVPLGQSIHFNKATQQFEIPSNTRFYKTFMKRIADTDGSFRYRKMETRLIVSRPDQNNADGTAAAQTALFGTYKWRDDESEADLIESLLHSETPFPDTLLTYNTDEQLAAEILKGQPVDPELALENANALRHYAIPSSQRCIQCHMGSPSQSFVLGFTPLEIDRRPLGVGGTIEETGADELTQLQRLIDYGVITGIDSPSDVLPLEQSQGTRAPRNDYELTAQGYVLGNCAHCHNPRGYPTSIQPLLADLLNFLPSATGGIFQFPLERYSPDIFRGAQGTTQIPFITPSLMDLPRVNPFTGDAVGDPFFGLGTTLGPDSATNGIQFAAMAPWRSLIYRNVQSAFTYEDDLSLFPHMPMNTPGYDPRAKQILSDWMVGIPSLRKQPQTPEYAYYDYKGNSTQAGFSPDPTLLQPYVEVAPDDPRYASAVSAAAQRLDILHTGNNPDPAVLPVLHTYSPYTDPGITTDIVDPAVLLDPTCHPTPASGAQIDTYNAAQLPFADHPHWVATDLSNAAGAYTPRRSDWAPYLVSGTTPPKPPTCSAVASGVEGAYDDQLNAISLDQTATLDTTFRAFSTTPRPMGLWQQKPGCHFGSQKTVADYTGASRARWMDYSIPNGQAAPPPTAPVYEETAGAEVFKMICINCHGKRADGNGFIAQNLALLTGGLARVADFRDGLFGPPESPDSNLDLAFGPASLPPNVSASWTGVTDDDRGARYMVWMALGGTQILIPQDVLNIVSVTPVFGIPRQLAATSANMLASAKGLCATLLGGDGSGAQAFTLATPYLDQGLNGSLIPFNGDAELWLEMCAQANPPPVHVFSGGGDIDNIALAPATDDNGINLQGGHSSFVSAETYMAAAAAAGGAIIGNEHAQSVPATLSSWPKWPWCVDFTNVPNPPAGVPACPPQVPARVTSCLGGTTTTSAATDPIHGCFDNPAANRWAVRGAMNAGFSVYLYVQSLETLAAPPPDFTQCEQLQ